MWGNERYGAADLIEARAMRPGDVALRIILFAIVFSVIIWSGGPIGLALLLLAYVVSNATFAFYLARHTGDVPFSVILFYELVDSIIVILMIATLWSEPGQLIRTTALMLLAAVATQAGTKRSAFRIFRNVDRMNLVLGTGYCIVVLPDGVTRDVEWLIFSSGMAVTLIFFLVTLNDLVSIRAQDLQRRVVETDRIKAETIGRLTAGVSHDFNNMLTVIGGNIELARTAETDEDRAAYLSEAEIATRAAARVTSQLQTYAGQAVLKPTEVDPVSDLTRLSELIARTLPSDIAFTLDLDEPLPVLKIDRERFETALLNLSINAQEAMPEGGSLTLSARIRSTERPPGDLAAGTFLVIEFLDTGPGIAPEILPKVREPYISTKGANRGAGLGLSMVDGFMLQSRGALELRSRTGAGTSAAMWFPVGREPAP